MRRLRPWSSLAVAGTIVLSACGGGDDRGSESAGEPLPAVDDAAGSAADVDADGGTDAAAAEVPVALTGTQVDLVGTDVVAEAEIATNLLPSVVLDDVSTGRKVNFRNLIPQDKPVLLWMYAPH